MTRNFVDESQWEREGKIEYDLKAILVLFFYFIHNKYSVRKLRVSERGKGRKKIKD